MITLHVGKLGAGKSYWATRQIWKDINNGKDVYANWKIDFDDLLKRKMKGWRALLWRLQLWLKLIWTAEKIKLGKVYYWETLDDLYKLKNGEVYFDEAHMAINARDFKNLPKNFATKLTQSRKYGLNLHFISQHSSQVDISVRRLANSIVKHYKLGLFHYWKEYDGEAIEVLANPEMMAISQPKSQGMSVYMFNKNIAKSYDTMALFDPFDDYVADPMWDFPSSYERLMKDIKLKKLKDSITNV